MVRAPVGWGGIALCGAGQQMLNVNTLDEIPDPSWFANRLGRRDMSIEEVVRGPNLVDDPAPGPWIVIADHG